MKIYIPNEISVHQCPITPIAMIVQQISFPKYVNYFEIMYFRIYGYNFLRMQTIACMQLMEDFTFYLLRDLSKSRYWTIMFYGCLKQSHMYFMYVINITYPLLGSTVNLAGNAEGCTFMVHIERSRKIFLHVATCLLNTINLPQNFNTVREGP